MILLTPGRYVNTFIDMDSDMEFRQATDELMVLGITAETIGEALGVTGQHARQMRLASDSPSYRRPPDDWRHKLAAFARSRGAELQKLAKRIEGKRR